jgi:hypothetical protein
MITVVRPVRYETCGLAHLPPCTMGCAARARPRSLWSTRTATATAAFGQDSLAEVGSDERQARRIRLPSTCSPRSGTRPLYANLSESACSMVASGSRNTIRDVIKWLIRRALVETNHRPSASPPTQVSLTCGFANFLIFGGWCAPGLSSADPHGVPFTG